MDKLTVNGYDTDYQYNNDSQITEVNDIDYDYDQTTGRLDSSIFNNVEESYTYNDFGERSGATTTKNGTEIYKNSYISSAFDYAQSPGVFITREATYDLEDRMLTYGENSYTYNERGTLLSKTTPDGFKPS